MKSLQHQHFDLIDEEWGKMQERGSGMVKPQWLKETACPVCDSQRYERIFVKKGLSFVQCVRCTHVFINPQLKDDVLAQHFKDSPAWHVWSRNLVSQKRKKFDVSKYETALEHVAKLQGQKTAGTVLDVGCSSGVFLDLARQLGWKVFGVEPSAVAAKFATAKRGLNVFCGSFKDYPGTGKFDLITFWASLEYNTNLQNVIRKAKDLLNPRGLILVLVSGNSHSLAMRMLQEKCVGFVFNRTHSFNPTSLDVLMKRHDLRLAGRYSLLPETRVLSNYLSYGDPYAKGKKMLFPSGDENILEKMMERNCMGYKFISFYKEA